MGWVSRTMIALALGAGGGAYAHKTNPMLQYTMKSIARDVAQVAEPTKKPNPADVTDGSLLTAITRCRTASYALQLVAERKDGEMLPGGIDEMPPEKQKQMMTLFVEMLGRSRTKLEVAESQLKAELAKANAEERNFAPLKDTLAQLDGIIADAHKVFRPQ